MNEKIPRVLGIGLVAAAAVVVFAPALAAAARPLARRGMKEAVKAYARGQEAIAELQEMAEDAYAEAWSELKSEAAETKEATETAAAAEEADREPKKEGRKARSSA